ncbi:MAG: sigma-70 family RNA polymerase sigma factor [Chitinophagaceae bacterium]
MSYSIITHSPENDAQLLRFTNGEEAALTYVYTRLYQPVLRYALRITGDEFASHTIVQEAFLRAWQCRQRMTSMLHLLRFIRLCTRWGCYDHFRQPATRFGRLLLHPDRLDHAPAAACDPETEENQAAAAATELERIALVQRAIPCLPGNRHTILALHFRYGLSLKQIARRFAAPCQHISREVQASIGALQRMILRARLPEPTGPTAPPPGWEGLLNDRQLRICRLRLGQKYSFDRIARELDMPVWQAVQEYVAAHELLKHTPR